MTQKVSALNFTADTVAHTLVNGSASGRGLAVVMTQDRDPVDITTTMSYGPAGSGLAPTGIVLNPSAANGKQALVAYWVDADLPATSGDYTLSMSNDPTIGSVFEISDWDQLEPQILHELLTSGAWVSPYDIQFTGTGESSLMLFGVTFESSISASAVTGQTVEHSVSRHSIVSKVDTGTDGFITLAASSNPETLYSAVAFNSPAVPAPGITSIDTDNNLVPGTTATVTGTNLSNTSAIDINGEAQTDVTVVDANTVTHTVVRAGNPYDTDLTLTLTSSDGTATATVQQVAGANEYAVEALNPNTTDEASLWSGLVDTTTGDPVTIVNGDQALLKDVNSLGNLTATPEGVISADTEGDFVVQIWIAAEGVWGSDQTVTFSASEPATVETPINQSVAQITQTSAQLQWEDGAFDTASLFSAGEVGVWYDYSDLSTMFQDSAGTTPVTADGDPVGLVQDKSGNANHLSQSGTSRPIYRTDGTNHWLEFDGTDDSMMIANQAPLQFGSAFTYSATIAPTSVASPLAIYTKENGTPWNKIGTNAGGGVRGTITTDAGGTIDLDSPTSLLSAGVNANASTRFGSGSFEVVVNGAVEATTAVAGTATYTTNPAEIGIRGGGEFFSGKMFGLLLINRALTNEEITKYARSTGAPV